MAARADDLAEIELFAGLDVTVLAGCSAVTRLRNAVAGEILAEQGEPAPGLLILLEGTIETSRVDGDRIEAVDWYEGPTWMGAVAVMTGAPMPVRVRARTPCRFGLMPSAEFRNLAASQGAVQQRVMGQIASVYARVSAVDAMRERLAAVSTMAAGLSELNNPVAGARRAAGELDIAMAEVQRFSGLLVSGALERDAAARLVALHDEARERAATTVPVSALAAADAEEALAAALEALGVNDAWRFVEPLAAAGLDEAWLAEVAAVAGPLVGDAARWMSAGLTGDRLVAELQQATSKMTARGRGEGLRLP